MSCIYLVIRKQALNKLRKNLSRFGAAFHQNRRIYHGHRVCLKCKLCSATAKGEAIRMHAYVLEHDLELM